MKKVNYKHLLQIGLILFLLAVLLFLTLTPNLMYVFRKPHGDNPFPNPFPMGVIRYLKYFRLL